MGISKNGMPFPEVHNPWFYPDFPDNRALSKGPGLMVFG